MRPRCALLAVLTSLAVTAAGGALPGELPADRVLGGESPFPPRPAPAPGPADLAGFDPASLGTVPPAGVHPRLLFGPEDLPDLRARLSGTLLGQRLRAAMDDRLDRAIGSRGGWGKDLHARLAAGDAAGADALARSRGGLPTSLGHYQPWLMALVLDSLAALVDDDAARGRAAATAVATWATLVEPAVDASLRDPLGDDVWRARHPGPKTGSPFADLDLRDATAGHLLGYAYDFAHPFMDDAGRATTRRVIAKATHGRLWMGARLPRHFRNWNWVALGLQQPLLALAIEGEEGYDPRVYRLGVEIAGDYLDHGISPAGVSTEAVGYTQFGFVWYKPFLAAAARRGDNLLGHPHLRAMLDWYLHAAEPARDGWTSHGDGGDGGPALWTLSFWRHHFPGDPRVDSLWRSWLLSKRGLPLAERPHLVEAIAWLRDDPGLAALSQADAHPRDLGLPLTFTDDLRGNVIARSSWEGDAAKLDFECRHDSVGASHEHADRGNFTFAALGRVWAKDNFRSVESRHHNVILVDGLGQGYWPGPGRWLGSVDSPLGMIAACDAASAYGWFWPKQILVEDPESFARFGHPRWASYREEARRFQALHAGSAGEPDPSPSVAAFWDDVAALGGGPRLWDEDARPVRFPWNPVAKAFRTVVLARGQRPWALVVDDFRKDDAERLHEWLMQVGPDTEAVSMAGNDIVLADAAKPGAARRDPRRLLVRVLELGEPADPRRYPSRPSIRLETFERRDTLAQPSGDSGSHSGSRSFGLDKRLVVASRSVEPRFRVLLFPHRDGEPLPETRWDATGTSLAIKVGEVADTVTLLPGEDGRTRITLSRAGQPELSLP